MQKLLNRNADRVRKYTKMANITTTEKNRSPYDQWWK